MLRPLLLAAAGLLGLAASPLLARLVRSWPARAAVVDHSMAPTLLPGDWVLVDPAVRDLRPRHIVVADDPDHPGQSIVKRVAALHAGHVRLTSDAGPRGYDVPHDAVTGRAWFRYWPVHRLGGVR